MKAVKPSRSLPPGTAEVVAAVEAAATRHRLLDAAGAVFAEVGYEKAHVRDICARAGANVAAIKYHFGGKYQLYEAAIGYWFDRQERNMPMTAASSSNGLDGAGRLRAFVAVFVARLLDRDKPVWHARLLAREMVEPTGLLDKMVGQTIRPTMAHLHAVVRAIVGPACPAVAVERAMLSVISQCVFYVHCRPVLERVFPKHAAEPDVAAIADHVATFSIAGVRAICRRSAAAARDPVVRRSSVRQGRNA